MPSPAGMYRPDFLDGVPPEKRSMVRAPQDGDAEPSYYDISMLKPPVWKWEIASYFFLGGVVGGSYVIARLADRFGGKEFKEITRIGTYTACAALIPCPLLLIHDLGDPARFHHMLRVWKPTSAMNLGTWVLTSFSGVAFATGAREMLRARDDQRLFPVTATALRHRVGKGNLHVIAGSIGVLSDAVGLPLAIALAAYTGVLVSNTAAPVWARNKWLSPLFVVGAMSTGASAIGLVMQAKKETGERETDAEHALKTFSSIAHAAEAATFTGYLGSLSKDVRKPYITGGMKHHTAMTYLGLAAAELLKHAPVPRRWEKAMRIAGDLVSLASAFSMRWAVVHAAHESAGDPRAARATSRATNPDAYRRFTKNGEDASRQPRERTENVADPKAISTIDPALGYNPNHA